MEGFYIQKQSLHKTKESKYEDACLFVFFGHRKKRYLENML